MNAQTGQDSSRSIGDVVRDLSNDVTHLVRDEMALARAETSRNVKEAGMGIVAIMGGMVLAFAALIILLQAVVIALSNVMPPSWAAIIVAVVAAGVGYVMVNKGKDQLTVEGMAPDRTVKNLKKDAALVKEHAK